jgi:hypothetical protein
MASISNEAEAGSVSGTVTGYFSNGEDAHRAIDELLEEGFRASEIGAAFHSGGSPNRGTAGEGASLYSGGEAAEDDNARSTVSPGTIGSGSGISGAASDTSAVTPAGLAAGSGTVTTGAGRPGPIPGGEIPNTLPSSLPRELPTAAEVGASASPAAYPSTGGFHETRREAHKSEGPNWWEKLKHVFGGEETNPERRREAVSDKTSMNFGTGEGHLGVPSDYDYAYSGGAFESAFTGMGVEPGNAKSLSREMRRGGAVVTVNAGALNQEAQSIFERNHGRVRLEAGPELDADTWQNGDESARVQVFGTVRRSYPGYLGSDYKGAQKLDSDQRSRKVS